MANVLFTRELARRLEGTGWRQCVSFLIVFLFNFRFRKRKNLKKSYNEKKKTCYSKVGRSNLANVLFTRELAGRLEGAGVNA